MASFITRRAFSTTVRRLAHDEQLLKQETKRNPELMILGGVMVAALAGAGFYFGMFSRGASVTPILVRRWTFTTDQPLRSTKTGRSPTSSTSEKTVPMAKDAMPWESGSGSGKYQYHPGGDKNAAPKDAPSAVNVVVVPNVELPKHLHDKYNKWGKDGY
ncbi:uncharacterized protein E0L32_005437 [Thyridium curvatum]|uniref:Uncharacterized protein n=1 Tax=Thyridium curvatum TaxID=1093900 RepID=A0A507B3P4_9PEZI|nr:uncharacterized protein E0L32_005437 [Thyridium curvatum]TPX14473.1 hypothetical protein E0L32_005437 [Thyridium curvatum]